MPSINVTDPANLPIAIFQISLSQVSTFMTENFLDKMVNKKEVGIKRDNYFMLNTNSNISFLQKTRELEAYHAFLHICMKKGFKLLMIKIK